MIHTGLERLRARARPSLQPLLRGNPHLCSIAPFHKQFILNDHLSTFLFSSIALNLHTPSNNSTTITMQKIMDTDYDLPVPMHRPVIMLNAQYDEPLPFRRSLNQVTELNAENSTPYTLPKNRPLSRLESLPTEIRGRIYGYLGIPPKELFHNPSGNSKGLYLVEYFEYERPWYSHTWAFNERRILLRLNRKVRSEVLDLLYRGVAAVFKHRLSN